MRWLLTYGIRSGLKGIPCGVYRNDSGLGRPAVTVFVRAGGWEPVLDLGV